MPLEKVLVGDDQIDFAREIFPYIPNAEIEFVANPDILIKKARTGEYSTIVTDLNYTENGEEGYNVLETLKDVKARKILWTGNAYDKGVRSKGESLDAEVLDKDEIGALVGQVVNKAPLKKDGKVLIYAHNERIVKSLQLLVDLFYQGGQVVVSSNLRDELTTNQYGLVIDTSTMMSKEKTHHGTVAHDMKYMKLKEIPRVTPVHNVHRILADIATIVGDYFGN